MKMSKLLAAMFAAAMGFTGLAMANCADDAIAVCNGKHPDPDKNYGAYKLCINSQLSQKCPKDLGSGPARNQLMAPQQGPSLPGAAVQKAVVPQSAPARSER